VRLDIFGGSIITYYEATEICMEDSKTSLYLTSYECFFEVEGFLFLVGSGPNCFGEAR
jgi:hypothetical protein